MWIKNESDGTLINLDHIVTICFAPYSTDKVQLRTRFGDPKVIEIGFKTAEETKNFIDSLWHQLGNL